MTPLLALLACGGEPAAPEVAPKAEAMAAMAELATPPPPPPPADGPRSLVPVEITWKGIGPLYKGFFSTSEVLTELSYALEPHLNGPVQLEVRYDSREFVGDLHVIVPPGALKAPLAPRDGRVDLQALSPITAALAAYRSELAGRFDVRIQSFEVGLDFFRGPLHCEVGVAGRPPPDGRVVSPCVQINGQEVCGRPEPGGVAFAPPDLDRLATCLGS